MRVCGLVDQARRYPDAQVIIDGIAVDELGVDISVDHLYQPAAHKTQHQQVAVTAVIIRLVVNGLVGHVGSVIKLVFCVKGVGGVGRLRELAKMRESRKLVVVVDVPHQVIGHGAEASID